MAGAGGQTTMIVPSHDLVVVRIGHYKGEIPGAVALRKALYAVDGSRAKAQLKSSAQTRLYVRHSCATPSTGMMRDTAEFGRFVDFKGLPCALHRPLGTSVCRK
jgi:hypothetical protein